MQLNHLSLQNFRNYSKADFTFDNRTTFIIGPNTAGKTNLLEAIYLLATGKSFRAEKEIQMIAFEQGIARIQGEVVHGGAEDSLEIVLAQGEAAQQTGRAFLKRYLVNQVPKRRIDFAGILKAVLFTPSDLNIVSASPSIRRSFLDEILEQVDHEYRVALLSYTKALRQRNALLEVSRETGVRPERQFEYWDELLIRNGTIVTQKREAFIEYINHHIKTLADFTVVYDSSTVSEDRLQQYKDAEVGAGVTLVGPHRDDFSVLLQDKDGKHDVRSFGSRGQQRLVVLQLKMLQIAFIEEKTGERPLLVLDDIFSELDAGHIGLVMEMVPKQQTIVTTTHEEFVKNTKLENPTILELKK